MAQCTYYIARNCQSKADNLGHGNLEINIECRRKNIVKHVLCNDKA